MRTPNRHVRSGRESRVRQARRKRGHDNAVALEFTMKRLGEAKHVRFGRRIHRKTLHALITQDTGNEENLSASPRPHVLNGGR
jgi:hypothetical protein